MRGRQLLLIVGMHRSGGSALARTLSLCGCALPEGVNGKGIPNPGASSESGEAAQINSDFLSEHQQLIDPTVFPEEIHVSVSAREDFIGRIREFLCECPAEPVLVIKDPRITVLLDFWLEAACHEMFATNILISLRHPEEVVASLQQSSRSIAVSREFAINNWLKMTLLAERKSRGCQRVTVEFQNLLADWRGEIARISNMLGMDLPIDSAAIKSSLIGDLRRQRHAGPIREVHAYPWATGVYSILSAAALDRPIDTASLDEIYQAYRVNARAFRISLADSQAVLAKQLFQIHGNEETAREGRVDGIANRFLDETLLMAQSPTRS